MQISEPATMVTDYALAVAAASFGALLLRRAEGQMSRQLWAASLLATAAAGALGGTYHGFALHISPATHAVLWQSTYTAIGLANLLILAGATYAAVPRRGRVAVLVLLLVRFAAYAVLLASRRDFRYVVYDFAVTLFALLALAWVLPRRGRPGAADVALGVFVSFVGALVQRSGFALHEHFNHNDLFHVVQVVGLWFFLRGGRLLRDV